MAVTYSTAVKTARMQAVANTVDGGTAGGKLKILDGASAVLATITLTDPCGAVAGAVLTFDFDPDISTTATATGTAANAIITDSADVTVVSGLTVGTTGTDVILDSTSITLGQTVVITAGTITHAA
jgi:hypothetical protein